MVEKQYSNDSIELASVSNGKADDATGVLLTKIDSDSKDANDDSKYDDSESSLDDHDVHFKLLNHLKTDTAYRKKFILSLAVFWSYVTLGWVVLQIGTALPDLQKLVDIDLDSASWLFTTWSLGFLMGSLCCGYLFDRCNRLVIMCVCALGAAVCSACLPYSRSFPVMLVLRVLTGIFCGGTDTGANTIIPSIWGLEGGPYMQALYLSYTVGGIVVPFGTNPFMTPQQTTHPGENTYNTSLVLPNVTYLDGKHNNSIIAGSLETSLINSTFSADISLEESEGTIQYALIVTSGLLVLSAIPYFLMTLIGGYDQRRTLCPKSEPVEQGNEPNSEETSLQVEIVYTKPVKTVGARKWFVLMCVFGVSFFYSATEDSLGDFIVTFCIDYLEWDNGSSVTLLSLYWVASCLGGLSGIILVRILHTHRLLFIAHICWVCTFLAALIASIYKIHLMIWIFIPTSGFFMVLVMPAVISWTEEHVCDVTGCVSAMIMISVGGGLAANPKFIGHMMEAYSYVAFLYILFVESVLCLFIYTAGYIGRYAFLPSV